jgi:hypothetical protein
MSPVVASAHAFTLLRRLLAHGKPLMGSEGGKAPATAEDHGHSITDEGFGEREVPADRH